MTRDGRATGRMIADTIRSALCAVGRDVIDADIAATPTTGVLIDQLKAIGGIQISASHNPPEYNGLKLFSREGRVISDVAGQPVLDRYRTAEPPAWKGHEALGTVSICENRLEEHAKRVLATVDVEKIVTAGEAPTKVYDPNNPLADKDGNIFQAAVDESRELVDMMETARSYQNNVEVMNTAKQLTIDTLKLGR